VHALTRTIDSHLLVFMALLPWVDIALARGRRQAGLKSLRYAFGLGREHGYHHVLGWQPELMARLCVVALEEGIEPAYARTLVRRRGLLPETPPYHLENWPWRFRVRTLGCFEIAREHQPLAAVGKAQRRPVDLLKVLVALGGREVRAEQVAEALWPHVDGDYAYRSLTTTLHRLRKLLGDDDAVLLRDGRLSLDPTRWWVDDWAFEQAAAALELALRRPQDDIGEDALAAPVERLLDSYGGPFLPGEDDQPQFLAHREQLRARFTRGVGAVTRAWRLAGQTDAALGLLERALEVEADNETLYGQLLGGLGEAGRTLEMAPAFARLRAALRATRGLDPSAEIRELLKKYGIEAG
jgi:DNA-binding SARP family transcriptional activator